MRDTEHSTISRSNEEEEVTCKSRASGIQSWTQALGAYQNILQTFKSAILSRNFDQNMR